MGDPLLTRKLAMRAKKQDSSLQTHSPLPPPEDNAHTGAYKRSMITHSEVVDEDVLWEQREHVLELQDAPRLLEERDGALNALLAPGSTRPIPLYSPLLVAPSAFSSLRS